jgi:hypothetical protein
MRLQKTALALACAALVCGCETAPLAPILPPLAATLRPDSLTPTKENAFVCSIVTLEKDGPRIGYRRTRHVLDATRASSTGYGLYRHLTWDRAGRRKEVEATCVLPLDKGAEQAAKQFIQELAGGRPAPSPIVGSWTGTVQCDYYPSDDHVECGGEFCTAWATSVQGTAGYEVAYSTYHCGNGCNIYDFSYYDCGDSSGDVAGAGGDGTGGGSGGGENTSTEEDIPEESSESEPTCDPMPTVPQYKAYCTGRVPEGPERAKVDNALTRLRNKGGACAAVADRVAQMLAENKFRIFNYDGQNFSGVSSLGGDYMALGHIWLETFETTLTSDGRNLDSMITHEADHSMRAVVQGVTDERGHLIENGVVNPAHTLNSKQCR